LAGVRRVSRMRRLRVTQHTVGIIRCCFSVPAVVGLTKGGRAGRPTRSITKS
jgi:hypothetical protein